MLKRFIASLLGLLFFISSVTFAQEEYSSQARESSEETYYEEQGDEPYDDYGYNPNFTLEEGDELPRSDQSKQYLGEIEEILSSEDFARKETVTRWRWVNSKDKKAREEKYPEWLINYFEWLEKRDGTLDWLPQVIEVLLWSLLIGLILIVLIRYQSQIRDFVSNAGRVESSPELPTTLFGLDVKKDSLPEDVVASAKALWAENERRQAIAVLLRASLIKLLHEYRCRFFDSDTEAECCDRIDAQAPEKFSSYMRSLVRVWQRVAYAHLEPSEEEFVTLCDQWREVF